MSEHSGRISSGTTSPVQGQQADINSLLAQSRPTSAATGRASPSRSRINDSASTDVDLAQAKLSAEQIVAGLRAMEREQLIDLSCNLTESVQQLQEQIGQLQHQLVAQQPEDRSQEIAQLKQQNAQLESLQQESETQINQLTAQVASQKTETEKVAIALREQTNKTSELQAENAQLLSTQSTQANEIHSLKTQIAELRKSVETSQEQLLEAQSVQHSAPAAKQASSPTHETLEIDLTQRAALEQKDRVIDQLKTQLLQTTQRANTLQEELDIKNAPQRQVAVSTIGGFSGSLEDELTAAQPAEDTSALQAELTAAQEQITQLKQQLASAQQKPLTKDSTTEPMPAITASIQIQTEDDGKAAEISQLTTQLTELSSRHDLLKTSYQELGKHYENSRKLNDPITTENKQFRAQVKQNAAAISDLQSKLQAAESQLTTSQLANQKTAQTTASEKETEIAALKQPLNREIKTLTQQISEITASLDEATQNLFTFAKAIHAEPTLTEFGVTAFNDFAYMDESLITQIASAVEQHYTAGLSAEIASLKTQITALQQRAPVTVATDKPETLQKLSAVQQENFRLQDQLRRQQQQSNDTSQQQQQRHQTEVAQLNSKHATEIARLEATNRHLEATLASKGDANAIATQWKDYYTQQESQWKTTESQLTARITQLDGEIQKLTGSRQQLASAKEENSHLRAELQRNRDERTQWQAQEANYQQTLQSYQHTVTQQSAKIEQLTRHVSQLEAEIQRLQSQLRSQQQPSSAMSSTASASQWQTQQPFSRAQSTTTTRPQVQTWSNDAAAATTASHAAPAPTQGLAAAEKQLADMSSAATTSAARSQPAGQAVTEQEINGLTASYIPVLTVACQLAAYAPNTGHFPHHQAGIFSRLIHPRFEKVELVATERADIYQIKVTLSRNEQTEKGRFVDGTSAPFQANAIQVAHIQGCIKRLEQEKPLSHFIVQQQGIASRSPAEIVAQAQKKLAQAQTTQSFTEQAKAIVLYDLATASFHQKETPEDTLRNFRYKLATGLIAPTTANFAVGDAVYYVAESGKERKPATIQSISGTQATLLKADRKSTKTVSIDALSFNPDAAMPAKK